MVHSLKKGKDFERKIANILKDVGISARRGVQFEGGSDSPDVVSELPFHLECKAVEKLNMYDAYKQSCDDSEYKKVPTVVSKKNNKPILITMAFMDFVKLMVFLKERELLHEFQEYIERVR